MSTSTSLDRVMTVLSTLTRGFGQGEAGASGGNGTRAGAHKHRTSTSPSISPRSSSLFDEKASHQAPPRSSSIIEAISSKFIEDSSWTSSDSQRHHAARSPSISVNNGIATGLATDGPEIFGDLDKIPSFKGNYVKFNLPELKFQKIQYPAAGTPDIVNSSSKVTTSPINSQHSTPISQHCIQLQQPSSLDTTVLGQDIQIDSPSLSLTTSLDTISPTSFPAPPTSSSPAKSIPTFITKRPNWLTLSRKTVGSVTSKDTETLTSGVVSLKRSHRMNRRRETSQSRKSSLTPTSTPPLSPPETGSSSCETGFFTPQTDNGRGGINENATTGPLTPFAEQLDSEMSHLRIQSSSSPSSSSSSTPQYTPNLPSSSITPFWASSPDAESSNAKGLGINMSSTSQHTHWAGLYSKAGASTPELVSTPTRPRSPYFEHPASESSNSTAWQESSPETSDSACLGTPPDRHFNMDVSPMSLQRGFNDPVPVSAMGLTSKMSKLGISLPSVSLVELSRPNTLDELRCLRQAAMEFQAGFGFDRRVPVTVDGEGVMVESSGPRLPQRRIRRKAVPLHHIAEADVFTEDPVVESTQTAEAIPSAALRYRLSIAQPLEEFTTTSAEFSSGRNLSPSALPLNTRAITLQGPEKSRLTRSKTSAKSASTSRKTNFYQQFSATQSVLEISNRIVGRFSQKKANVADVPASESEQDEQDDEDEESFGDAADEEEVLRDQEHRDGNDNYTSSDHMATPDSSCGSSFRSVKTSLSTITASSFSATSVKSDIDPTNPSKARDKSFIPSRPAPLPPIPTHILNHVDLISPEYENDPRMSALTESSFGSANTSDPDEPLTPNTPYFSTLQSQMESSHMEDEAPKGRKFEKLGMSMGRGMSSMLNFGSTLQLGRSASQSKRPEPEMNERDLASDAGQKKPFGKSHKRGLSLPKMFNKRNPTIVEA